MECVECGSPCGVVWMGREDFLAHMAHFRRKIMWRKEIRARGRMFWWCHHCHNGGAVLLDSEYVRGA